MSLAPLHACAEPRCSALIRDRSRCPTHSRGSSTKQGYGSQWRKARAAWLSTYPLCGMRSDGTLHSEHSQCIAQGRTTVATDVDHIDGHSRHDDHATFYDANRLQSLCRSCHSAKTRAETGRTW